MGKFRSWATLASLVAVGFASGAQTQTTTRSPTLVLVAAWRDDGVLVPFAKCDSGVWSVIWPEVACGDENDAISGDELPLTGMPETWLRDPGQPPSTWFGFSWESFAEPLKVQQARRVDAHCCGTWGLPVLGAPQPTEHGETQGIALTSKDAVQPFVQLDPKGAEGRKLSQFLMPVLADAETVALRRALRSPGEDERHLAARFPADPSIRARTPFETFFVKAVAGKLGSAVFYNVERSYQVPPADPDSTCGAVVVLSGWLRQAPDGTVSVLQKNLDLTDCDQKDFQSRYPYALVQAGDKIFVLERRHGYEDESYAITQITPKGLKLVLEKNGGGC